MGIRNPTKLDAQSLKKHATMESRIAKIEASVIETTPEKRWPKILDAAKDSGITPSIYRQLWDNCFDESSTTIPIWFPSDNEFKNSNIACWMSDLNLESYDEFHRWTIEQRAEFWQQAVDRLGIEFSNPPESVLDDTQGIAQTAWFPGATINIAECCFRADPDAVAILAQRPGQSVRQWTYGELRARANQVANSLVDRGYKVGDSLGVVMPMTDWSVAIYLGILLAGCNVVSIADSFAPPEIATRLDIADAKAVFTYDHQNRAGRQLPLFRRVAEASEIPAIVLSTDDTLSVDIRDQDLDWSEFLVERNEFSPIQCQVQETINILFSSGTTGDPKAIPWNQLTPIKCAVDGYCHQNIQPGDVCAWPTNLGWMMGPWLIFASLINRASIALYEDAPMGAGFGQFVQDVGVTMLGVVPTIVKAWQSSGDMEAYDWSKIKVFSSTGESSQSDTMVYLSSLAEIKPIIEYCGGTEIGGGYITSVVVLPNFPAAFNTAAVGLDFVLLEQNENSSDKSQPVDEGEVFLVPPSIGLSNRLINRDHFETYYAEAPQIDGYQLLRRHGDHFRRLKSDQRDVYVAGGRADDTMNLGGIKISSAEIERVLNRIDGIVETAAVAFCESGGPDELVVFAVSQSDSDNESLKTAMNRVLKSDLNPLFKVHSVRTINSMPRTASGKVMRRQLRNQIQKA